MKTTERKIVQIIPAPTISEPTTRTIPLGTISASPSERSSAPHETSVFGLARGLLKKHSKESVAPQGSLQAASAEVQAQAWTVERRIGARLEGLGSRLGPQHTYAGLSQQIQAHPYGFGLSAFGVGVLGGLLFRPKFRRA